jgi:hypothetical protein
MLNLEICSPAGGDSHKLVNDELVSPGIDRVVQGPSGTTPSGRTCSDVKTLHLHEGTMVDRERRDKIGSCQ